MQEGSGFMLNTPLSERHSIQDRTRSPKLAVVHLLLLILPAVLFAADPSWKSKQPPEWNEADAKQLLADSPWGKTFAAVVLPDLTLTQRQSGGASGGGKGGGLKALQGLTLTGIGGVGGHSETSQKPNTEQVVTLRWESALPVRVAELKAGETSAPNWQDTEYAIGVYQVPGLQTDDQSFRGELKKIAVLKRDGKKDIKPTRVEVIRQSSNRATVFYFFPRSDQITLGDKRVTFVAQIGRLYVARYFFMDEMQFQGKLEL